MEIDLQKVLQMVIRCVKLVPAAGTGYFLIALGLLWLHPAWALIFVGFVLITWNE